MSGYEEHYRQACRLAELADLAYAASCAPGVAVGDAHRGELRRAEVLAQMSTARGQLAWVAYMGVDALAEVLAGELAATDPQPDPQRSGLHLLSDARPHPSGGARASEGRL